jgi:hypothetical protein
MGGTVTVRALCLPEGMAWQAQHFEGTAACCTSQKVTAPEFPVTSATSLVGGELLDAAFDVTQLGGTILAYKDAAAAERAGSESFGVEIGDQTFAAGTWRSGTITMSAGATVTLDGEKDPNSVFLLQAVTTMTVGAGCAILLVNEAKAGNVSWSVGTLTTGDRAIVKGNVVASSVVTFGANNEITGSSIVAGSAITFCADNDVRSCVIANTAITFGAANFVTVVQEGPSSGIAHNQD